MPTIRRKVLQNRSIALADTLTNSTYDIPVRISNTGKLLLHARNKRQVNSFNDVTIKVQDTLIQANKLVLTCFSNYFDSKFEEGNVVEIHGFDVKTMRLLIDYMYGVEITINQRNVSELLPAANHLQLEEVTRACLDFLLNMITATTLSMPQQQEDRLNKLILEYLHVIVERQKFKDLSKDELWLVLKVVKTAPEPMFFIITNWCNNDRYGTRKKELYNFFMMIDLSKATSKFLENTVLRHPLVKESGECISLIKLELCRKLTQQRLDERKETDLKILCVGGDKQCTVSDIHSLFGKADYPLLPYINLSGHCAEKVNDFVYCIGGTTETDKKFQSTERTFRMNINEKTWIEVAPLQERRSLHAAAICKGKLVVAGGNDFNRVLNTAELYDDELNNWSLLGGLRCGRSAHAMAACGDYILAIGGDLSLVGMDALPTVEKLSGLDGDWNYVASMSVGRKRLAAAMSEGKIYAIGGRSSEREQPNTVHKSVERYDAVEDRWSFVSEMNVARYGHSACVLRGRIFVAGGLDSKGSKVKTMECYDPEMDSWSIVGDIDDETEGPVLVTV